MRHVNSLANKCLHSQLFIICFNLDKCLSKRSGSVKKSAFGKKASITPTLSKRSKAASNSIIGLFDCFHVSWCNISCSAYRANFFITISKLGLSIIPLISITIGLPFEISKVIHLLILKTDLCDTATIMAAYFLFD